MCKNVQFLYKYLFLLADHAKEEVSVRTVSNLLRPGDDRYLTRLIIPTTKKSPDAFFGLVIETLTVADTEDIFKNIRSYIDFKNQFLDLAFSYSTDVVFDNDRIPREQFDFIVHSLYAYNRLGKRENVNPNNPKGLYLLSHLSRDYSDVRNTLMLRQQLTQGIATFQVFEILNDLKQFQFSDREALGSAIDYCEENVGKVFSDKSSRFSSFGILAHKPIQVLMYHLLESRDIAGSGIETRILSDRKYRVDQAIKMSDKLLEGIDLPLFKEIIKRNINFLGSSVTVEEILSRIEHMVIDYTLSSSYKVTIGTAENPGKVRKHYQSDSTFFFIVNYKSRLNNPQYYDNRIKKMMVRDSINNPEMVSFIGIDEFVQLFRFDGDETINLFGTEGTFFTILNKILTLTELAQTKRWAFTELRDLYNDASKIYSELKGVGVVDKYIGDLV